MQFLTLGYHWYIVYMLLCYIVTYLLLHFLQAVGSVIETRDWELKLTVLLAANINST